jgi:hypothetical protein
MPAVTSLNLFGGTCPDYGVPDYYQGDVLERFLDIRLNLEDTMAFFWRVKTWQIETHFTGFSVTHSTVDYLLPQNVNPPEDERQLICEFYSFACDIRVEATKTAQSLPPFGPYEYIHRWSTFLSWSLGGNVPIYHPQSQNFSIKFFDSAFYFYGQGVRQPEHLGNLQFKFIARQGEYVPEYNSVAGESRPELTENDSVGYFILKPAEYWPYDPGDGLGPIYDSATGAQLRPFPA